MIALLLTAQIVWNGPRLTPAEAARVLATSPGLSNATGRFVCSDCDGPRVVVIPSRTGEGPFGPFPRYRFRPLNCCSLYINGWPIVAGTRPPIFVTREGYRGLRRLR